MLISPEIERGQYVQWTVSIQAVRTRIAALLRSLGNVGRDQALTAVCSTTGNTSFARTPGTCTELVTGINTDTTSSSASGNTSAINSCQGRCGQEPAGWSCGCAAGSVTKCSNYAAANCANFNAR